MILLQDISVLNSDDLKMYYAATTLTQFGPLRNQRAHTHIVFARQPHWEWCDENLTEITKDDNQVFWCDPEKNGSKLAIYLDGDWLIVTCTGNDYGKL